MDFIVKADRENVNLLFRRPRKDQLLNGTSGGGIALGPSFGLSSNTNNVTSKTVNWVDDPDVTPAAETIIDNKKICEDKVNNTTENPSRITHRQPLDEESIVTADDTTYTQETEEPRSGRSRRRYDRKRLSKRYSRRYTSENFLDKLIDSICAPLVGESSRRKCHGDDDYSDDDITMNSADDSTFVTYDSSSYVVTNKEKNSGKLDKSSYPIGRNHRKNEPIEEKYTVDNENVNVDEFGMKVSGKNNKEDESLVSPHLNSSSKRINESELNYDNIKSGIPELQPKRISQQINKNISISKDNDPLQDQEDNP